MAKTIAFSYKDKDYVLEYSRETIEMMEKQGFNISEINSKPMSVTHKLFAGAFKKNHPSVSNERIDEIYDKMTSRGKMIEALTDMYREAMEALVDEEGLTGEIQWAAN